MWKLVRRAYLLKEVQHSISKELLKSPSSHIINSYRPLISKACYTRRYSTLNVSTPESTITTSVSFQPKVTHDAHSIEQLDSLARKLEQLALAKKFSEGDALISKFAQVEPLLYVRSKRILHSIIDFCKLSSNAKLAFEVFSVFKKDSFRIGGKELKDHQHFTLIFNKIFEAVCSSSNAEDNARALELYLKEFPTNAKSPKQLLLLIETLGRSKNYDLLLKVERALREDFPLFPFPSDLLIKIYSRGGIKQWNSVCRIWDMSSKPFLSHRSLNAYMSACIDHKRHTRLFELIEDVFIKTGLVIQAPVALEGDVNSVTSVSPNGHGVIMLNESAPKSVLEHDLLRKFDILTMFHVIKLLKLKDPQNARAVLKAGLQKCAESATDNVILSIRSGLHFSATNNMRTASNVMKDLVNPLFLLFHVLDIPPCKKIMEVLSLVKEHNVPLEGSSLLRIVRVLLKINQLEVAEQLYNENRHLAHDPTGKLIDPANFIVTWYAKNSNLDTSLAKFKEYKEKGTVFSFLTYQYLIQACSKSEVGNELDERIYSLYEEVVSKGIAYEDHLKLLNTTLRMFISTGKYDSAMRCFYEIRSKVRGDPVFYKEVLTSFSNFVHQPIVRDKVHEILKCVKEDNIEINSDLLGLILLYEDSTNGAWNLYQQFLKNSKGKVPSLEVYRAMFLLADRTQDKEAVDRIIDEIVSKNIWFQGKIYDETVQLNVIRSDTDLLLKLTELKKRSLTASQKK